MRSVEFEKIADLLARQYKIHVKEGERWAANILSKTVYYRKKDIYTMPEDHILGLLLHEIAHIHYTTDPPVQKQDPELMHTCVNMLEDLSVEHIISGDYPNAGEILNNTRQEVLDTLVRILPKLKNDITLHEKALLFASARFDGRGYTSHMLDYEKLGDEISKIMIARKDEILERKMTQDLIPMAREIADILLNKFGQLSDIDKERLMQEAKSQIHAVGTDRDDSARGNAIRQMAKGWGGDFEVESRIKFVDKIADKSQAIGRRLRAVLKRNNAMEFGGRFRSGKIMTKRLSRIRILKDQRIFGKRIIKSNLSYAFAAASDVSGSMMNGGYGGTPCEADYALTSLYMVSEALRIAGVPRAMIIFAKRPVLINPINRLTVSWSAIASREAIRKANSSDTEIGEAMRECRIQLEKVRAERKIMIILTDGCSDEILMRRERQKADIAGIQCIGITVGNDGYTLKKVFDKENLIGITDLSDSDAIGNAFISILKTTVTKSI